MNDAELALMGLLMEAPNHAYQLEQIIEERNMREWTEIGFSSIYYLLNKLESAGLVLSEQQAGFGGGPARKVYQPTAAGRAAWRQTSLEALIEPPEPRSRFLLAMSQAPGQPRNEVKDALRQRGQALIERRDRLLRRWQQAGPGKDIYLDALFELPLALIESEGKWLDQFIQELDQPDTT